MIRRCEDGSGLAKPVRWRAGSLCDRRDRRQRKRNLIPSEPRIVQLSYDLWALGFRAMDERTAREVTMPYMIGPTVASGSSVSMDFEPEIDDRLMAIIGIRSTLTPEERAAVPRALRIGQPGRHGVPSILGWNIGPYIVSPRVRELLEELEPGRHDYIPIAIKTERDYNGTTEHGTYNLILPPPCLDAVVIEETEFRKGIGRKGFEDSDGWISNYPDDPCVLKGDVVAGRHLWRLSEIFHAPYVCSDELWRRIKAEKLTGWMVEKKCLIRR